MKKVSEIVQRIEKQYVGEDCIQVMTPYKREITIFNKDGILFSHNTGSHISVNKYLDDERRKQFPYSNIPTHYSRISPFMKFNYANQLFDFEVPYIRIGDCSIIESFAVKDKNEALLINKVIAHNNITGNKKTSYVTRKELEELYTNEKTKNRENKFVLHLKDSEYIGVEPLDVNLDFQSFTSEEKIYEFIEKRITNGIAEDWRKYSKNYPYSTLGHYLLENPIFLDYLEQSIDHLDLTKIKFNLELKGNRAIILRTNESDISLQYVEAKFVNADKYKIESIDLPVNKYTLEQLKHLSPVILKTKEPRIPLRLNPGITKQDIQEAKQMVKTLKK